MGIASLSLYAFSTENWGRPATEVQALMGLMLEFFQSEIDELDQKNVRITILGDKEGLPRAQRDALITAEVRTRANTGLRLNIAINYGARAELVRAAQPCPACRGSLAPDIDEKPPPVHPGVGMTLICTSGEMRLSNFC